MGVCGGMMDSRGWIQKQTLMKKKLEIWKEVVLGMGELTDIEKVIFFLVGGLSDMMVNSSCLEDLKGRMRLKRM